MRARSSSFGSSPDIARSITADCWSFATTALGPNISFSVLPSSASFFVGFCVIAISNSGIHPPSVRRTTLQIGGVLRVEALPNRQKLSLSLNLGAQVVGQRGDLLIGQVLLVRGVWQQRLAAHRFVHELPDALEVVDLVIVVRDHGVLRAQTRM